MMDLSGQSFGKWKVLYLSPNKTKENKPMWVCRCECGNIKEVSAASLKAGQSKSCGECKGFATPYLVRTHSNRLYHAWSEMHRRCNGQSTNSDYYSEKGICVCPEWNDFDSFANWSITHDYEKGYEIDRIDSDKDYSPDNCRWVTHKKNSRNRKARSNNKTGVPGSSSSL